MAKTRLSDYIIMRKVEVYPSGVRLSAHRPNSTSRPPTGVKRGKVVGFSRHSAQRLRERLIKFDYANAFALALTAPDYSARTPEEAWGEISRHIQRYGVSALVWRKEVTRRGRSHYHLVVWPVDGVLPAAVAAELVEAWVTALFRGATAFDAVVTELGLDKDNLPLGSDYTLRCQLSRRSDDILRKRREQCRKVNLSPRNFRVIEESLGYIRYLLDHTSKHKDYQSKTTGRAWGVVGTPPTVDPLLLGLGLDEFIRIVRVLRKSSRYRQYCDCVFGHKRSFGRRYRYAVLGGTHVQFGATLQRLVTWVTGRAVAGADGSARTAAPPTPDQLPPSKGQGGL